MQKLISSIAFLKQLLPFTSLFVLHKYSCKWESISFLGIPLYLFFTSFASLHILSTVWVWTPVTGSTKFLLWLTVLWSQPSALNWLYDLKLSEYTREFGSMWSSISWINVNWLQIAGQSPRSRRGMRAQQETSHLG